MWTGFSSNLYFGTKINKLKEKNLRKTLNPSLQKIKQCREMPIFNKKVLSRLHLWAKNTLFDQFWMKMCPVPVSGYYSMYDPLLEVSGPIVAYRGTSNCPSGRHLDQRPWFTLTPCTLTARPGSKAWYRPNKEFASQRPEKCQALRWKNSGSVLYSPPQLPVPHSWSDG